jgi:hypothetical protein
MAWVLDVWGTTIRKLVHGDEPHYRQLELWRATRPGWHRTGVDTRRFNAAGKLIGEHTSKDYSPVTYYRKAYWRAERRYQKALLRGELHPRTPDGYRSDYNWRGL